jgi:hypothetical protein
MYQEDEACWILLMHHTDNHITTERSVRVWNFLRNNFFLCLLPKNENRYSVCGIKRCQDQVSRRWVLEVKCPGCKGDHSPPFTTDLKNTLNVPPLSHMLSWHAQGKFYFYLYIIKNSIFPITAWIYILTSNFKKWHFYQNCTCLIYKYLN